MDENQIEVHWLKTPRQCEENWSDFVHLHQKRRAELGQPGCFADPQFEYFLRQVVLELSSSGQAILGLVKHQQKSIAATLLLMSSDTASMYQSGIDPEFSHLEPGHLINNFSLQWTQQQGKTTFDFLRGDESYKRGWGATRTELYRTRMIAPRWSSKLKHSLWLMARRAKKMVVDTASPNSQVTSATEEVKSC